MRSMFSVMPAAKGSRFATGTPLLGQRFDRRRRSHPRLSDVGAEYGELRLPAL